MKKLYILLIAILSVFAAQQLSAQRYVHIEPSEDITMPADIFNVIKGDTTATGDRVDNNTIYQLTNGAVYITTGRIVNKPEWDLQIEALDLEDTANKAILTRIPNASGSYNDIMRAEGNVTLKNIWIISGEKGPLEQHDWGKIRLMSENTRLIAEDCIIEKDRGGFFQLRASGIKAYLTNCVFRNGGNRRILQGNGRAFDARNNTLDTLIMKNCIVYNIQDRLFRSQGASQPHNYIEIDHCTSFNTVGRHGFIQLGRVVKAKITNNLFINPIMIGSSPFYADEQTQPDNDLHKVITLDTLYDNTSLTVSNNNIFWTQDVLDYWASNDTVSAPGFISQLIVDNLGAAAGDAYFQDPVELSSVPGTILQYVVDLYNNPAAEDMFDFIVEDIAVEGTAVDSGNLFDFSTFDPCYPASAVSATADTEGGAVGATFMCPELMVGLFDVPANHELALQVFPNPVSSELNFKFTLPSKSEVSMSVLDINGRVLMQLLESNLGMGEHVFNRDLSGNLTQGIYFLLIQTNQGLMTQKFVVQ